MGLERGGGQPFNFNLFFCYSLVHSCFNVNLQEIMGGGYLWALISCSQVVLNQEGRCCEITAWECANDVGCSPNGTQSGNPSSFPALAMVCVHNHITAFLCFGLQAH